MEKAFIVIFFVIGKEIKIQVGEAVLKHHVLAIIFVFLFTSIMSACEQNDKSMKKIITNEKILSSKEFQVTSTSTDLQTSINGTVFLSGENGEIDHAQIVSMIEIDLNDWGGIVFYTPKNWNISKITSSYPEKNDGKDPKHYEDTWSTENPKADFNKRIEIGTNRYTPTGGGKGTVVIELDASEEIETTSDTFNILVGVGSTEEEANKSIHPDSKLIKIPTP